MLAKQLLDKDFTPLHPKDAAYAALAKMDAWQTTNIPVVEPATSKMLGQVTLKLISDLEDESTPLSELTLENPIFTFEHQHVFEVARQMLYHEIRLLPVVDEAEQFIGIVHKKDVLEALSGMLNVSTVGSVITVEMNSVDFTLTELVHLIEQEEAKILGLTVERDNDDHTSLKISIKLNLQDTSAVISSLQRHGYVTSTENKHDLLQIDMSSRADELIRYLDL